MMRSLTTRLIALLTGCAALIAGGGMWLDYHLSRQEILQGLEASAVDEVQVVVGDLENWLNRLVPENDPIYTHTLEGADDMPAHIKSALTATQVSVPFRHGKLMLGTWQGIYLWEHRHHSGNRSVVVHL